MPRCIEEALRPGAADLFHVAWAAYNWRELKSTLVVTVGVKWLQYGLLLDYDTFTRPDGAMSLEFSTKMY